MHAGLRITIGLAVAAFAAGCGATPNLAVASPTPTPVPLSLAALSFASIPADAAGLRIVGTGFDAQTRVELQGPILGGVVLQIPDSSLALHTTLLDGDTLDVSFDAAAAGGYIGAGDYRVIVHRGDEASAPLPLHVRPILLETAELRALPKLFLKNGGFLNVYVRPSDSTRTFLAPGAELAAAIGLGHANFQLSNVKVTPIAGGTPLTPDFVGVNDVLFDPISSARPLAVSLAIDQSGSIATTQNGVPASDPTDERVTQSEAFLSRLGVNDRIEVLAFSGNANNVRLVTPFSTDHTILTSGLETLRTGETGGTPLYDAMIKAVNDAAAATGDVVRAAIVLTDGRDNGSAATPAQAIAAAKAAGIPIFTIGLGNPADAASIDQAALTSVSDQTGGRFLFAQDPAALAQVFDTITGLLQSTYELDCGVSFDPPITTTGSYTLTGDVATLVDGHTVTTHLAPLTIAIQ